MKPTFVITATLILCLFDPTIQAYTDEAYTDEGHYAEPHELEWMKEVPLLEWKFRCHLAMIKNGTTREVIEKDINMVKNNWLLNGVAGFVWRVFIKDMMENCEKP